MQIRNVERLAEDLVEKSFSVINDKKPLWDKLKYYYYTGTPNGSPALVNKVYSYVDTLASMLYAAQLTVFSINTPIGTPPEMIQLIPIVRDKLMQIWDVGDFDQVIDQAVKKSIVYGSCFIKTLWTDDGVRLYLINPWDFGVANQNIEHLDDQEWLIHRYYDTPENVKRYLKTIGKEYKFKQLSTIKREDGWDSSPFAHIINASLKSGGEIVVDENAQEIPEESKNDLIEMYEIWVKDDNLKDYRIITWNKDAGVIFDRENFYMKHNHPFSAIIPVPAGAYGYPEIQQILHLQDWVNERVSQLKELMYKQLFPSIAITGAALTDEEAKLMYQTEGILNIADPTAHITPITIPSNLQAVFAELSEIDKLFYEISGIKEIMLGGVNSSAVRTAEQTSTLAVLASSRVKKKVFAIQNSLEKLAHLIVDLLRTYDKTKIPTQAGEITLSFFDCEFEVKIDAHSQSPLFAMQWEQDLVFLLQSGIIDGGQFVELKRFPNWQELQARYYQRQQAAAQAQIQLEQLKHGKKA